MLSEYPTIVLKMRNLVNRPLQVCNKYLEDTKGDHTEDDAWINAAVEKMRKEHQPINRKK